MKFGFATLNDVQHEFANRLKERVEAQSNGRLKVEVYPASQLGNNQRMIEGVQLGTQEAMIQPPEFVFGLDPRYVVLSLPYLFDTADEANKVLAAPVADQIIDAGESKGLKGLSVIQYGFAGILGHYQVRTPDDLRGKKIRVLGSQIELDTLSAWARRRPDGAQRVGPGLQQKTVDGVIQAPQTYLAFKFHEIAPYYTTTEHYIITSIFLVNKGWYEHLQADLQRLLADQAKALQNEMSAFSDQKNAETLKITRETPGDEVIVLTPDQRNLFKATAQSVWDRVPPGHAQRAPAARRHPGRGPQAARPVAALLDHVQREGRAQAVLLGVLGVVVDDARPHRVGAEIRARNPLDRARRVDEIADQRRELVLPALQDGAVGRVVGEHCLEDRYPERHVARLVGEPGAVVRRAEEVVVRLGEARHGVEADDGVRALEHEAALEGDLEGILEAEQMVEDGSGLAGLPESRQLVLGQAARKSMSRSISECCSSSVCWQTQQAMKSQ